MEIDPDDGFIFEVEPRQLELLSLRCYISSLLDRTLEDFADRFEKLRLRPKYREALVQEFKEWGGKGNAGLKVMYASKETLQLHLRQKAALKRFFKKFPKAKNCQKDFDLFQHYYEQRHGRPMEDPPDEIVELIE